MKYQILYEMKHDPTTSPHIYSGADFGLYIIQQKLDKVMPSCTTMSRLKCEGSFVEMCMNRLALRDVLKESIVLKWME